MPERSLTRTASLPMSRHGSSSVTKCRHCLNGPVSLKRARQRRTPQREKRKDVGRAAFLAPGDRNRIAGAKIAGPNDACVHASEIVLAAVFRICIFHRSEAKPLDKLFAAEVGNRRDL